MFDVQWTDEAINELSGIWTEAHPEDRALISTAVNEIEETLVAVADTAGEGRATDVRILIIDRVATQYILRPDEREAIVVNVWRTSAGSSF